MNVNWLRVSIAIAIGAAIIVALSSFNYDGDIVKFSLHVDFTL